MSGVSSLPIPESDNLILNAPCNLCGSAEPLNVIYDLPDLDTGHFFKIVECSSCGAALTRPVPDNLDPYYRGEVGAAMRERGGSFYRWLKQLQFDVEISRIKKLAKPEAWFADIGCGSGEFAAALHQRGFRVAAMDSAPGRPIGISDTPNIDYYEMSYDTGLIKGMGKEFRPRVAILRHVLEHVRDPQVFLSNLMKQGIEDFYIAVPNKDSWCRRLFGASWYFWDPPRHLWHFNPASLRKWLTKMGIKILAEGGDISPTVVPSIYRFLRMRKAPAWIVGLFGLKSSLNGILGAPQIFLPRNTIWIYARVDSIQFQKV